MVAIFGNGLIPAHAGKTRVCYSRRQGVGAHPRSRGENESVCHFWNILRGSSPLTRGKLCSVSHCLRVGGLIPAHAGKTRAAVAAGHRARAHPRSRGENCLRGLEACLRDGSSPLTRGKPYSYPRTPRRSGLIPAHAGKTSRIIVFSLSLGAHPRSRGENLHLTRRCVVSRGSSPLTRGKLVGGDDHLF